MELRRKQLGEKSAIGRRITEIRVSKTSDYRANEIIKIIRGWTALTQKEFGETISLSRHTIQSMEIGRSGIYLQALLNIVDAHGIIITIEKK